MKQRTAVVMLVSALGLSPWSGIAGNRAALFAEEVLPPAEKVITYEMSGLG